MATRVIGDYTAAVTIDGTTNYLLIQPGSSSTAYNKINRNVFLGVTGQPADISTSQNLTNKTLNNTNTVTLKDSLFTLQDDSDTTKQAQFQLSGITTATTRTYTLPNASSTLADIATTQTFTNKTLTSPTITGGSIDQTTITVDAITGHTTANTGTIYGVAITAGKITGAGSIGNTALATNAVQASQLATNAITLGFTTYTTADFSTASSTAVQITGLTATVTIPAGGRKVKITAFIYEMYNITTGDSAILSIWDGTVGSGTQLAASGLTSATGNAVSSTTCIAIVTPAAGSKTYNVGLNQVTGGTAHVAAGATTPGFILVETI